MLNLNFGKGDYKTTSSTTAMMADLSWQHYSFNAKLVIV